MEKDANKPKTEPSLSSSIPSNQKIMFLLRLGSSILFLNLLVIVMVGLSIRKSHLLYQDRAAVSTQNLAKVLADNIYGAIDKIDLCLHTIVYEAEKHLAAEGFNKRKLDLFIQRSHSFMPELESLRIADAQGEVIIGIGVVKRVNITDRDYFIKLRDEPKAGLVIAQPVVSRMTGKWVLNIARRINNPDGSFAGVVFAQLSLDYFTGMFSKIDIGKNGTVTLRDGELGFITRYPEFNNSSNLVGQKLISQEFKKMIASNRETGTYFTPRSIIDNKPRTLSYRKITNYPLYIIVGRATSDYLDDWKSDSFSSLLFASVFIVTTLISTWVMYGRWHKQMLLTEELRRSKDELESRVTERTAELDQKQIQLEEINRTLEERVQNTVAELRSKDQLMIQQSRQAAMGEMINNIAHQWKQPLNNLALILQSIAYQFDAGLLNRDEMTAESRKCVDLIIFMSQTIDDFRSFFREDKIKSAFGIRQSITRAVRLVSASLKDNSIKVIVEPGDEIMIEGFPNEYAQVLLNLLGNARDVMLERLVDDPVIKVDVSMEDGHAVVSVSDNGGGIPEAVIESIFDPYFTTKGHGKGTGIGLFMSKIIIEKHLGGALNVCNLENGASFRIAVPVKAETQSNTPCREYP